MDSDSVTVWINRLSDGDDDAAQELWQHLSIRLMNYARHKLDAQTRRSYDENDAANSAFHSLCRGLADGRLEAENRDAVWGLLAVITSRKISAQRRIRTRLKRGGGDVRGESGFGEAGLREVHGDEDSPETLAEFSESCDQLLDAIPDELVRHIVLLKFQGWKNAEVAEHLNRSERTIERKLERVRLIWEKAGLHDPIEAP